MGLDIKKIYIDSRFRTSSSKHASDFYIELPGSFSVPDDAVCFIEDIIIPNSWLNLDARNNTCYFILSYNFNTYSLQFVMTSNNYDGGLFAI